MPSASARKLVLGAYLSYGTGHHAAAWRHPEATADGAQNIDHYTAIAQTAERGLFDFMFLSDTPSVFNDDRDGYGGRVVVFEPLTLLSAVAICARRESRSLRCSPCDPPWSRHWCPRSRR